MPDNRSAPRNYILLRYNESLNRKVETSIKITLTLHFRKNIYVTHKFHFLTL